MSHIFNWWKRKNKGVELVEDLNKWKEIPQASSLVQRLKEASERAHERHRTILSKWRSKLK